ncbi:MAG TPA: sigma 54-interacting transcriptional regulator, partial [Thermotogota bacterium]|nr:sigma 54-interacting transcriptional regulator [Thermotogota bacterium]
MIVPAAQSRVSLLVIEDKKAKEASEVVKEIITTTLKSKNLDAYVEVRFEADYNLQGAATDILVINTPQFKPEDVVSSGKNPYIFLLFTGSLSVETARAAQKSGRFELFPTDRFYGERIEYSEIARFAESLKRVVRELAGESVLEYHFSKSLDWKIRFDHKEKGAVSSFIADPVFQAVLSQAEKALGYLRGFQTELIEFRQKTKRSLSELGAYENDVSGADLNAVKRGFSEINAHAAKMKTKKIHGILLTGETGSGKTRVAEWIASRFLDKDFASHYGKIPLVNIAPNLIDSELFGTFPGAFTDARYKTGKLLSCAGGVVFLDEIGEIPATVQAKLLTFLDDRKALVEGYNDPQGVVIPLLLIAATNRNVREEIKKGDFRNDLYHRFLFKLHIPPIRDRKNDFRYLLSYVLQSQNANIPDSSVESISLKAIETLEKHDYPGNFRELEDIVRRALLNADFARRKCILAKDMEY